MKLPANVPRQVWAQLSVALLALGILSSLLEAEPPPAHSLSSYGAVPHAWGAAYDLLRELELGASRSREPLARRKPGTTQWLIDPRWEEHELGHELDSLRSFASAGATVVLIGADERVVRALGASPAISAEAPGVPAPGADKQPWQELTRAEPSELTGSLLARARSVELTPHRLFDAAAAPSFVPRAQAAGGAFVLERAMGKGRLVLVASVDFLTNERLGNEDNAPFLVDLSRGYGAPVFDERCHGFSSRRSLWSVLGPAFFGVAGCALLLTTVAALANRRRWPSRQQADPPLAPPTLEVFVASLASLYQARGRRDVGAVFRAYRAGYMRRLQRLLFGQREISHAQLEARVRRDAIERDAEVRWLGEDAAPRSVGELVTAVSALERYAGAIEEKGKA